MNPDPVGPLSKRACLAIEGYRYVGFSIICLFFASCPSHVSRLVIAGFIYPVNGVQMGRFWANVIKERLKRMKPFVAHCNASAAIPIKGSAFGVTTSGFYSGPYFVFLCCVAIACAAVNGEPFDERIVFPATTTFRVATSKRCASACDDVAAITFAMPKRTDVLIFGVPAVADYGQSTKAVSKKAFESWVAWNRMKDRHSRLLESWLCLERAPC